MSQEYSRSSAGGYSVSLTASDDDGNTPSVNTSLTVDNAVPALDGFQFSFDTTTLTASLSWSGICDAGSVDTQSVPIDWGDNTTGDGMILTHSYLANSRGASYTVTVTVSDDDGGSTPYSDTAVIPKASITSASLSRQQHHRR